MTTYVASEPDPPDGFWGIQDEEESGWIYDAVFNREAAEKLAALLNDPNRHQRIDPLIIRELLQSSNDGGQLRLAKERKP